MSIINRIKYHELSYDGGSFLLPDGVEVKAGEILKVVEAPENITEFPEEAEAAKAGEGRVYFADGGFEGISDGDIVTFMQSIELKEPQSMQWDISDLDGSSGRNQMGRFFRDRIASKRSLSCTWGPLDDREMSELLQMMEEVFFTLEYPDALTGKKRTGEFYVGNRSVPMMRQREDGSYMWQNVSATFTER